tara:strand:+ start:643 stop:1092 length:450 start_codon:yes stop_codon:yes gene_type:complete
MKKYPILFEKYGYYPSDEITYPRHHDSSVALESEDNNVMFLFDCNRGDICYYIAPKSWILTYMANISRPDGKHWCNYDIISCLLKGEDYSTSFSISSSVEVVKNEYNKISRDIINNLDSLIFLFSEEKIEDTQIKIAKLVGQLYRSHGM